MVRDHEVACSSHVASTRTGIRAHLAPFLRVRTAVIYLLVNSLVFTLKSSRSATLLPVLEAWQKRYSYIAILKRAHLAPFLRVRTVVIYLLVNSLVLTLKSSRSATLLPALAAWQKRYSYIAILKKGKLFCFYCGCDGHKK